MPNEKENAFVQKVHAMLTESNSDRIVFLEFNLVGPYGATKTEVTIKLKRGSTEGEIQDTISRCACQAYDICKRDLDKFDEDFKAGKIGS